MRSSPVRSRGGKFRCGQLPETTPAKGLVVQVTVASQTVEAVQGQVELEIRLPQKLLQRMRPHLPDMHEPHVIRHEGKDGLRVLPGELQALQGPGGDLHPPRHVAVEMNPLLVFRPGGRFSRIMKEHRPGQAPHPFPGDPFLRQQRQHAQGVFPDVALGVEAGRLVHAAQGRDLRKESGKESCFRQEFHAPPWSRSREDPAELFPQPLGADPVDLFPVEPDRLQGGFFDQKSQIGGEADRPEHPEMILGKAFFRRADGPDDLFFQIRPAAHIIDDLPRLGIHKETVDRKIPAVNVLPGGGEGYPGGVASVPVIRFLPVGRHFVVMPSLPDQDHPEGGPDGISLRKDFHNLLGTGGGDHVVIIGFLSPEEIPDAAADEKSFPAGPAQGPDNGDSPLPLRRHPLHPPSIFLVRENRGLLFFRPPETVTKKQEQHQGYAAHNDVFQAPGRAEEKSGKNDHGNDNECPKGLRHGLVPSFI